MVMGCNGIEHLCKEVLEEKKGLTQMDDDKLVSVREEVMSQEDDDDSASSKEVEDLKENLVLQVESSSQVTSLPQEGLNSLALSKLVSSVTNLVIDDFEL
jgi:hypothetical protein